MHSRTSTTGSGSSTTSPACVILPYSPLLEDSDNVNPATPNNIRYSAFLPPISKEGGQPSRLKICVELSLAMSDFTKAMGVHDIFDDQNTDFSGIWVDKGLAVSTVVHRTLFEVFHCSSLPNEWILLHIFI